MLCTVVLHRANTTKIKPPLELSDAKNIRSVTVASGQHCLCCCWCGLAPIALTDVIILLPQHQPRNLCGNSLNCFKSMVRNLCVRELILTFFFSLGWGRGEGNHEHLQTPPLSTPAAIQKTYTYTNMHARMHAYMHSRTERNKQDPELFARLEKSCG